MKKIICAIYIALIFGLSACNDEVKPAPGTFELDLNVSTEYQMDDFFTEFVFNKIGGVFYWNDVLFVTDKYENRIYVFTSDGNLIRTIGETGNGELQFLHPTAITYQSGLFYVLDNNNNRIQILNEDFTYNSERTLNEIPADEQYVDIAVDEQSIAYVTTMYGVSKYAHIYEVFQNGVVLQVGENFIGYITNVGSEIWAANKLEMFPKEYASKTAHNYLYKVRNRELKLIKELPYKYMPGDFIERNGNLYFLGGAKSTLDRFSLEGEYEETLFEFANRLRLDYLCGDENGDVFYVTSSEENMIYRIKKAGL